MRLSVPLLLSLVAAVLGNQPTIFQGVPNTGPFLAENPFSVESILRFSTSQYNVSSFFLSCQFSMSINFKDVMANESIENPLISAVSGWNAVSCDQNVFQITDPVADGAAYRLFNFPRNARLYVTTSPRFINVLGVVPMDGPQASFDVCSPMSPAQMIFDWPEDHLEGWPPRYQLDDFSHS